MQQIKMEQENSNWSLLRILKGTNNAKPNEKFFPLRFGRNSIGRNPSADIITESIFASRIHCSIDLDSSGKIILTDSVSSPCDDSTRIRSAAELNLSVCLSCVSVFQRDICQQGTGETREKGAEE